MGAPLDSAALQRLLDGSPFSRACKLAVRAVDPEQGKLTLSMPFLPNFARDAEGTQFHGGPIAALIDTAGCFALVMQLGQGAPTLNFRSDYLRPAGGALLLANAVVRRAGRTVGVVDVDVLDDADRLVAVGRGCFGTRA
jgi:uncharacterized protein (TIGR00369 family)